MAKAVFVVVGPPLRRGDSPAAETAAAQQDGVLRPHAAVAGRCPRPPPMPRPVDGAFALIGAAVAVMVSFNFFIDYLLNIFYLNGLIDFTVKIKFIFIYILI